MSGETPGNGNNYVALQRGDLVQLYLITYRLPSADRRIWSEREWVGENELVVRYRVPQWLFTTFRTEFTRAMRASGAWQLDMGVWLVAPPHLERLTKAITAVLRRFEERFRKRGVNVSFAGSVTLTEIWLPRSIVTETLNQYIRAVQSEYEAYRQRQEKTQHVRQMLRLLEQQLQALLEAQSYLSSSSATSPLAPSHAAAGSQGTEPTAPSAQLTAAVSTPAASVDTAPAPATQGGASATEEAEEDLAQLEKALGADSAAPPRCAADDLKCLIETVNAPTPEAYMAQLTPEARFVYRLNSDNSSVVVVDALGQPIYCSLGTYGGYICKGAKNVKAVIMVEPQPKETYDMRHVPELLEAWMRRVGENVSPYWRVEVVRYRLMLAKPQKISEKPYGTVVDKFVGGGIEVEAVAYRITHVTDYRDAAYRMVAYLSNRGIPAYVDQVCGRRRCSYVVTVKLVPPQQSEELRKMMEAAVAERFTPPPPPKREEPVEEEEYYDDYEADYDWGE